MLTKAAWWLLHPAVWLAVALALALLLLARGRAAAAAALVGLAALLWLAPALLPLNAWLAAPLENRFPARPEPDAVDGIVVLGGALRTELSLDRGEPALSGAAERMTAAVALARRYPNAVVLYSGWDGERAEAEPARAYFRQFGLEGRVLFEDRSRDTWENARYSKAMVDPRPGQTWLLVTSALHMPRAVLVFRRVGFEVVPYPVDYLTERHWSWRPDADIAARFDDFDVIVSSWVSLIGYRVLGRTQRLLPAVDPPAADPPAADPAADPPAATRAEAAGPRAGAAP